MILSRHDSVPSTFAPFFLCTAIRKYQSCWRGFFDCRTTSNQLFLTQSRKGAKEEKRYLKFMCLIFAPLRLGVLALNPFELSSACSCSKILPASFHAWSSHPFFIREIREIRG
jgi:hypothetical protein